MILGSKCSGSGWSPIGRFSGAGSSSPTDGVVAADARARPGTPWPGGWRTSRSGAAHGVGGQPPPIPVHRVRSRVAPGHVAGRRAAGDAVATWPVVGAGRPGVPTPECRPRRRRSGGLVEHRQRRGPGRGPPGPDRRPAPLRRRAGHRRERARLAAHPAWRQVRHRDHRPDADPRRHRPGAASGHGRRPLQTGVQGLARRTGQVLARRYRGRRDGRVHRVQDRRRRRATRGCRR